MSTIRADEATSLATSSSPAPLPAGRVAPVPVAAGYRVALVAVAVAMVLLPLVYLAIVAAAAWGGYLYAATVWPRLSEIPNLHVKVLAGAGPPIAAAILVFYMLRSMWPRRSGRPDGVVLREREEPRLHELVWAIADALGAPRPREIRVDLQVNASAGLRRGLLSLFGRDLVLTLGLPLAAGLTTRQLSGIVAHELGHFAQRGGMGVSFLIRSIQAWFARVVFERGDFDAGLDQHAAQGSWATRAIAQIARLFLWISRKILGGLMYLGAALSAALSRQMEYDADRYEARLVGARTANETSREMARLNVAGQGAWSELASHWRDGRLTDDIPALVSDHRRRLPPELVRRIDVARLGETREWHATHPTFAEREASLLREPPEGIFRDERPATSLFADFQRLCRVASIEEYRARLGSAFTPDRLIDIAEVERTRERESAEGEAFVRLFGRTLSRHRPIGIDLEAAARLDRAVLAAGLAQRSAESAAARAQLEADNDAAHGSEERLDALEHLAVLDSAGVPRAEWGEAGGIAELLGGEAGPATAAGEVRRGYERRSAALLAHDVAAGERLAFATTLAVAEAAPEAETALHCARALADLEPSLPTLLRLRRDVGALHALWSRLGGRQRNASFVEVLESRYRDVQRGLERLHRELYPIDHPLSRDPRVRTLQHYVVPVVPDSDQPQDVVATAEEAIDRAFEIRARLLTRLAALCEPIERRLCAAESPSEAAGPPR